MKIYVVQEKQYDGTWLDIFCEYAEENRAKEEVNALCRRNGYGKYRYIEREAQS